MLRDTIEIFMQNLQDKIELNTLKEQLKLADDLLKQEYKKTPERFDLIAIEYRNNNSPPLSYWWWYLDKLTD